MLAGRERVSLLDDLDLSGQIKVKELPEHGLHLGVADDGDLRIPGEKRLYGVGVVRLHMVDDQIIQLPAAQCVLYVFEKRLVHGFVHRVEQHGLLVLQQVGVVRNALRHPVNALEAGKAAVIRADPCQVVGDFSCKMHREFLLN